MVAKRIASFLPSATELIYELGAGGDLVGVTHECTYPAEAMEKPKVINSVFDPEKMTSKEIDEIVSRIKRNGEEVFTVVEDNLKKANPDLIIGQGTCAVCSAYTNQVKRALEILENKADVEVIDPHTVDDVLDSVMLIAGKIGRGQEGRALLDSLRKRIDFVRSMPVGPKPKVLCIEWVDPFFTAGHWVPQMIEIAGGINVISITGERSRRMTMDEVEKADADIIIMMPCGFDTERTTGECYRVLSVDQRWRALRAVKNGNVYAVDANAFFSKPSIRTVTGIEVLAKILHSKEFEGLSVPEGSFSKLVF